MYGKQVGRVLFGGALVITLFGPAIRLVSGPVAPGTLAALAAGVAAQVAATILVARRPYAGFAATVLVTIAMLLLDSPWPELFAVQAVPWVPLILAWSSSRVIDSSTTPRQLWPAAGLAVAYLAAVAAHAVQAGLAVVPLITAGAALPILGGTLASFAARLSWARIDRMEALAAEREATRRLERAERDRQLATELHDTLGHQLTLLVLHANTMAVTTRDGETKGSAAQIARLGNNALADVRQLSGILAGRDTRDQHAMPATAQPDANQVVTPDTRELIREAALAGQRIEIRRYDELIGVPAPQAAAIHRIVQEGLSNARVHAPGEAVELELIRTAEDVKLTIRNHAGNSGRTGAGVSSGPRTTGGLGLLGLRQRIELLRGALEAGDDPAGGYLVQATLPLPAGTTPGGAGAPG